MLPTTLPTPLFSYVVATYNCAPLLGALAATAQRLSGGLAEICVADGGSIDGGLQVLQSMQGIRLVRAAPDRSIYDAWNQALPFVRGRYVGFLGVDDEPGGSFMAAAALAVAAASRAQRTAPALIYGDILMHRQGRVRRLSAPAQLRLLDSQGAVFDLHHPGCLLRADLFAGDTPFDASFKLAGDFEFFVRKAPQLRAGGVLRLDDIQAEVRDEGVSRRPQSLALYAREFARIEQLSGQRLGHRRSAFPWLAALARRPLLYRWARSLSWMVRGHRVPR